MPLQHKRAYIALGGFVMVGLLATATISLAGGDTWTKKADMPAARALLSASVMDGKIYVIGGMSESISQPLSTVEEYDPATDTWTRKADMPTARHYLSTSVANGKIYAIGGAVTWTPLSTVEEYDPATDTWTKKSDMPTARGALSTSVVNGKIYAIGGGWVDLSVDPYRVYYFPTVEEYDPATDTWTKKSDMPTGRFSCFTSVVNGKIYAIGGQPYFQAETADLRAVQEYDPTTDTWAKKADMPTGRITLRTSVVGGKIYAIGGSLPPDMGARIFSTVEVYDPVTDLWTSRADMPGPRTGFSISMVDEKIYAIGGSNSAWPMTAVSTVEEYVPEEGPTAVEEVAEATVLPLGYALSQNVPNPFNPVTTIAYDLPQASDVTLTLYTITGQKVMVLVDAHQQVGHHTVRFDGSGFPTGVYLYRLKAAGFVETKPMALLK